MAPLRRHVTWPELLLPLVALAVLYLGSLALVDAGTDAGIVYAYQVVVPAVWLVTAVALRRRRLQVAQPAEALSGVRPAYAASRSSADAAEAG